MLLNSEVDVKNAQGPESKKKHIITIMQSFIFTENIELFASIITRTALDIDILIDSLPSNDYTLEKQVCARAHTRNGLLDGISVVLLFYERRQKL